MYAEREMGREVGAIAQVGYEEGRMGNGSNMTAPSGFLCRTIKAWDCTNLDVRDAVLHGIRWRLFRAGRLTFNYDGRSRVDVRGELYGKPFAVSLAVTNTARKFNHIRTQCPRCSTWSKFLLATEEHAIGCYSCLPLYPNYAWWTANPYRRSKTALLAALTGTDPVAQRRALWALELGPINLGRKRTNPTKRQQSYPDAWGHDEEMQELRLLLTGRWPWE